MRHSLSVVVLAAAVAANPSAQQPEAAPATPPPVRSPAVAAAMAVHDAFGEVARAVRPGVVTLRAFVKDGAADAPPPEATSGPAAGWVLPAGPADYPGFRLLGTCSGFVVDAAGEILTCNHALRRADGALPDLIEIETHDFARLLGEIVGAEPTVNLAIVQATVFPNGHPRTLPALRLGDSDAMQPGQWTLAFGDPAGPERFVAVGTFIAQPSRDCYQDLLSAFYLQVGLQAHPEAYGGPLVDLDGNVIAILAPRQTAPGQWQASPRLGIEFGLPSKIVVGLHESIRTVRSLQSPWLGLAVMSRPELAAARGLEAFQAMAKPRNGILVENVFQPGPAFDVGIAPGDWLVTFGKTRIFTPVDFQRCLYLAGIGTKVELELFRDGQVLHREAIVQLRPAAATPR